MNILGAFSPVVTTGALISMAVIVILMIISIILFYNSKYFAAFILVAISAFMGWGVYKLFMPV